MLYFTKQGITACFKPGQCAGLFYYNLGNLHPKYRSNLDSVQLLAVVRVPDIVRYGIDAILQPIIEDVKALEVSMHRYIPCHA